jgi:hypothetical protein
MKDTQITANFTDSLASSEKPIELIGKSCFVIMPFQTKVDRDGRPIDFEEVFSDIIKPAVESAGLSCEKADSEPVSGLIHNKMINSILRADVVIADTTTTNANVFYELGIRHTARPSGTIIICRRGTTPPFDTNGMLYLEYVTDRNDPAFLRSQQAISAAMVAAVSQRRTDSLARRI